MISLEIQNLPEVGRPVLMGSMLAPSVSAMALMLRAGTVYVDSAELCLPKRHSHHRYGILGPNGLQQLSVPLVGETNAMRVPADQVLISNHHDWVHLHSGALLAAYGRTPYYPYLIPELLSVYQRYRTGKLLQLDEEVLSLLIDFLALPITVHICPADHVPNEVVDIRSLVGQKQPLFLGLKPYHQAWSDKFGFQPGLSVIDLAMNLGREAYFALNL